MSFASDRSPPRIEAALKIRGAAEYAAEVSVTDPLYAALVTSRIPRGRILRIDSAQAASVPGFVSLLTHENAPRLKPGGVTQWLVDPIVHFAGQAIALVLAESSRAAKLAAAQVEVSYEELPATTSLEQGIHTLITPKEAAGGVATDSLRGDPERGFKESEIIVDRTFTTPTHNHHALEPHAVIAYWQDDTLVVHTATQAVFGCRRLIAHCFDLPPERVRVITQFLGGGFGSKGRAWFPVLLLALMAVPKSGRAVKLELTREQMFTLVCRRQETIQHLKIGATRTGHLKTIVHDTIAQTSTYAEHLDPMGTPARVMYACANVATTHRLARVNAPQPNPMRAPGEGPGSFALESALDELAYEVDLDPLELRRRNFAEKDWHMDRPWSSNGLLECYRVAAEAFGWVHRPRKIGATRDGRNLIGLGMASACYPVYRMASEAIVRAEPGGIIRVLCCTQDMGTGTYTVLGQLAADILEVPFAQVRVEIGDSRLPEGPYSGGSIATASFTPAVEEAARKLRSMLIEKAREPSSSLSELLAHLTSPIEAHAKTEPEAKPAYSSYGFGAIFAEVKVDGDLGEVRVSRLTAAYAAGRILNPLLARSQYIGGLIGGIGMALHEETGTDARLGRIVNTNLSSYLIPVHADMPKFDVHMIEEQDPHLGGGIKGIGMLGTVGTAAAIANAVFHATGKRVRDLPIRIEDLL